MVPDIAKAGHSFKGAMAYYLHDKRQDGQEAHPQTAERVAWTEMRNLACLTPETATRIMAATASRADELKAAAGIKNTGRKSNAHVYAYSLAWHPDEAGQIDKAEMLRAVDQTLKALGAENHQAVIVCHQDQKHPHVHVVLNRVDPATGKMLSTSNDRHKLSDWANAYERERGVIVTPKREEKRQAREQAQQDFTRAAAKDRATPDPQKKSRADSPTADPRRERPKSEAALLKELSDAQKAQHKQQWVDLSARNKAQREKLYDAYGAAIRHAAEAHKRDTKPAWAAFFRAARESEHLFQKREQSISGILHNALAATPIGQRRSLSAIFHNVVSAPSRAAAFQAAQETTRGNFARELKAGLDAEITMLKAQRGNALAVERQRYTNDRAALIERQDAERAKMREAWRQVYERRGKDPHYSARQNAARQQEQKAMIKRDFDNKARELAPAKPAPHPHNRQSLSTPAPTPAPAGVPVPAQRKIQNVPEVSRKVEVTKAAPSTTQQDFGKSADKPMSRADYWNQKAKEKAPDRARDRSRDRDFDRER